MLNLQINSASGCWTKKRCSQDCCKNFFGQTIESDARAFQSSLKCRFFDPSWQHSIRESRTYFNVFMRSKTSNRKTLRNGLTSFAVEDRSRGHFRVILLPFVVFWSCWWRPLNRMNTANWVNLIETVEQLNDTIFSCKAFDVFLHYGILLNGSVDLIRVLVSYQRTKALSDLTAKLGLNVDGTRCVFGLSRNAYQRHFRG